MFCRIKQYSGRKNSRPKNTERCASDKVRDNERQKRAKVIQKYIARYFYDI